MADPFLTLRIEADKAEARLHDAVRAACPGPVHKPQQHRDQKPPWCAACGRDDDGVLWNGQSNWSKWDTRPAEVAPGDEAVDRG